MIELLANHVWQSTLCAVAAALLAWTLKGNRAHVRYCVWLIASLKFLVPFAALVAVGGWFTPPAPLSMAAIVPNTASVARVVDAIGRPFSTPRFGAAMVVERSTADQVVPPAVFAIAAGGGLWFAGSVLSLAVWSIRWRRAAAAVARATPMPDGPELRALHRLQSGRSISRRVRCVSTNESLEPGVFGVFNPVLLWPRQFTARLADNQIEAILAHELCHVHRRDNLAAAAHALVQAVFWFHPIVWCIGARLIAERERACDEEVVRMGADPCVYARSILAACRFSVESPRLLMASATAANLHKRIERIVSNQPVRRLSVTRRCLLVVTVVAAVTVPLAIGLTSPPRLRAQGQVTHAGLRGFGPREVNRLAGFELLPGPPPRGESDPPGAVAWTVSVGNGLTNLSLHGFTARGLIRYAYGLGDTAVLQGPEWLDRESIAISAAVEQAATDDQVRAALRTMFDTRIRLVAHHETRRFPVYSLVKATSTSARSSSLRPSDGSCLDLTSSSTAGRLREVRRGVHNCGVEQGVTGLTFAGITMSQLAEALSQQPLVDRQVVDRSGMHGVFDGAVDLGFLPASAVLGRYPSTAAWLERFGVRSLSSALPEQLGLTFADDTLPRDVLVIDRAERPAL